MIMKNKKILAVALIALVSVIGVLLSSCSSKLSEAQAIDALYAALNKSAEAEVYYWKETANGRDISSDEINPYGGTFIAVNSYGNLKEIGKNIYDYDGDAAKYKLYVRYEKYNNSISKYESEYSIWADNVNGGKTLRQDDDHNSRTADPIYPYKDYGSASNFINSAEWEENYSLASRLAVFGEIKPEHFDFNITKAQHIKNMNVIKVAFKPTKAFYDEYALKYGEQALSVLHGCNYVYVEILLGKISNIIIYRTQKIAGTKIATEIEPYKLEVSYLGPRFSVPNATA